MTQSGNTAACGERDRWIPVRKGDLLAALIDQGAFTDGEEREKFADLCEMLTAIYHYEYFKMLERLRGDYYYFSPDVAAHAADNAAIDRATLERAYADLQQSLDQVLKEANFVEVPHAEIEQAHRERVALPVEVKAPLHQFREVRFYRRGCHYEKFLHSDWFGLRKRSIEAKVYDDVVVLIAMKPETEFSSQRELRRLERRKIVPGSILLKYFRNVASGDLNSLFPNIRVVMSTADKFALGVPALFGGIPILLKLYATITVLFLVAGVYLGAGGHVADKDTATALAALGGLVAFGGFVVQQWIRYQRQSLRYQIELGDNIYFRNINNNAGIFDYLIGAAEDQECKEAFLAYHFLHAAAEPPTAAELDSRIEAWLDQTFKLNLDFQVGEALARLEGLGLLKREGERLFVSPLDEAFAKLHRVWDGFFAPDRHAKAAT